MPLPSSAIYLPSPDSSTPSALRQGELITDLAIYRVKPEHVGNDLPEFEIENQPIVLILTQDCDLDWDFRGRFSQSGVSETVPISTADKLIPCVLFCEVVTAHELFGKVKALGSKVWDRIKQNNDIRYHFLQRPGPDCDAVGEGLGELAIDFKRYSTVRTDELYRRVTLGTTRRRCILRTPYLENLCHRFAHFLSRVALPEPHFSEPAPAPG